MAVYKRPITSLFFVLTVFAVVVFATNPELIYAQSGLRQTGQRWPSDQLVGIDQIQHEAFDALLKKYVDTDGMVDYRKWHKSAEDRKALQTYIANLSRANHGVGANRDAQLAYWINAYNAVTLEGILAVYPTDSIRKHTSKLGYDIWKHLMFTTGDRQISLNDIEHKVLRKMNKPRIHFAIVCASIGCPRLLNEAYTAKKLDEQLATNTRDFFSRSRNLQFNRSTNQLKLSAIMQWFGTDFAPDTNGQLRALAKYFPKDVQAAAAQRGPSVSYLDYDWNLNIQ